MKVEIEYTGHGWGCHPETCCCHPFSLKVNGKVLSKYLTKGGAEKAAKILLGGVKQ